VENSWARNQLASHNEGLLLLLFSGGVIEEHGTRGWEWKKMVGGVQGVAVARVAIMLPLSPDNIKCLPSPIRAVFFVILHNLFLAIVPAIEFLLLLVEGEESSVARRSGGNSRSA